MLGCLELLIFLILLENMLNVFVGNVWSRNGPNRSGRFVICCSKTQSIKCVTNRKVHLFQPIAML